MQSVETDLSIAMSKAITSTVVVWKWGISVSGNANNAVSDLAPTLYNDVKFMRIHEDYPVICIESHGFCKNRRSKKKTAVFGKNCVWNLKIAFF